MRLFFRWNSSAVAFTTGRDFARFVLFGNFEHWMVPPLRGAEIIPAALGEGAGLDDAGGAAGGAGVCAAHAAPSIAAISADKEAS